VFFRLCFKIVFAKVRLNFRSGIRLAGNGKLKFFGCHFTLVNRRESEIDCKGANGKAADQGDETTYDCEKMLKLFHKCVFKVCFIMCVLIIDRGRGLAVTKNSKKIPRAYRRNREESVKVSPGLA
jgi:hypothetical protein